MAKNVACVATVIFLALSAPAGAELYISPVIKETVQYDDARSEQKGVSGTSTVHGDFSMAPDPEPGTNLMRYGSNVPLFVAMEHLVPEGSWKVHLDDGYENRVVSWEGGSTWEGVLTAIADQNELSIVMNHRDRVVGVSGSEALAVSLAMPVPEVWRVNPSLTLKDNLEQWAAQAGWSLSWDEQLKIDYPITQRATLVGPFSGAGGVVDRLLSAFRSAPIPLTATFYTQNNVVRVSEAGYRKEEQ